MDLHGSKDNVHKTEWSNRQKSDDRHGKHSPIHQSIHDAPQLPSCVILHRMLADSPANAVPGQPSGNNPGKSCASPSIRSSWDISQERSRDSEAENRPFSLEKIQGKLVGPVYDRPSRSESSPVKRIIPKAP
jgi:hypothetical protein